MQSILFFLFVAGNVAIELTLVGCLKGFPLLHKLPLLGLVISIVIGKVTSLIFGIAGFYGGSLFIISFLVTAAFYLAWPTIEKMWGLYKRCRDKVKAMRQSLPTFGSR